MNQLPYIIAIIPVFNEASTLTNVLHQLLRAKIKHSLFVCNGCTDRSIEILKSKQGTLNMKIEILEFQNPLGHDISKAIGTYHVMRIYPNASHFLYIDADLGGSFGPMLYTFIERAIKQNKDVTWVQQQTDSDSQMCVQHTDPWAPVRNQLPASVRSAAPSLIPLFIRRTVFQYVSPYWLHQPGLWFAYTILACKAHPILHIGTDETWDIRLIGHKSRSQAHTRLIQQILSADGSEGCSILESKRPPVSNFFKNMHIEKNGSDPQRNIEFLHHWMQNYSTQFVH